MGRPSWSWWTRRHLLHPSAGERRIRSMATVGDGAHIGTGGDSQGPGWGGRRTAVAGQEAETSQNSANNGHAGSHDCHRLGRCSLPLHLRPPFSCRLRRHCHNAGGSSWAPANTRPDAVIPASLPSLCLGLRQRGERRRGRPSPPPPRAAAAAPAARRTRRARRARHSHCPRHGTVPPPPPPSAAGAAAAATPPMRTGSSRHGARGPARPAAAATTAVAAATTTTTAEIPAAAGAACSNHPPPYLPPPPCP